MNKKADKNKSLAGIADYNRILVPVITEKSSFVGQSGSRFVFKVDKKATKNEIRESIERIFGVNVISVNTLNVAGKLKRTVRGIGRKPDYKKAYVTLAEGQTISVVEGL